MVKIIRYLKTATRILSAVGSVALLLVFVLASLLDALGEDPDEVAVLFNIEDAASGDEE